VQELLETMERRAEERADAILAEARAEVARIRERTGREIERRRAERAERVKREADREVARTVAAARREAVRASLAARAAAIDRVFERARARLAGPEGRASWAGRASEWLERALSYVDDDGVTVECDRATADALRLAPDAGPTISPREDAPAGFRLRQGPLEVDVTLDGLLERARPRLAVEVAARLDDDGST
jgi:vacuolar-type H+-ATPase subunit E/Vma4